jgi:hypothetical protein
MRFVVVSILALALGASAETKLGKPLTLKQTLPVSQVAGSPETYAGRTVQVQGKVAEVCHKMGCWMSLVDSETGKSIRIKVNDGEIVFPKAAVGKTAIAEGKLVKIELSKEQAVARAKHEAEEQGRKFDPDSVRSGATVYQIEGTGAVLID